MLPRGGKIGAVSGVGPWLGGQPWDKNNGLEGTVMVTQAPCSTSGFPRHFCIFCSPWSPPNTEVILFLLRRCWERGWRPLFADSRAADDPGGGCIPCREPGSNHGKGSQFVSIASGKNPTICQGGRNSERLPHDPGRYWCGSFSEHMVRLQREQ